MQKGIHQPFVSVVVLLILSAALSARGGDPQALEVLEQWQKNYEASIEGIDDYVMEEEHQTIYYKKAYNNGRPYFKSRVEGSDQSDLESTSNLTDTDFFSAVYDAVRQKAEYKGTDELDGHRVHVIYVDELDNLFEEEGMPENLRDVYLRIDPDKWVPREIQYTMDFEYDGELRELTMAMQQRDYREVEGMQVPYETGIIVRGLALTESERKEAEEGLKQFEEELEDMPEAQRRVVEQMAGDRIAQFRRMLEEDIYETVNRVKSVRVNTGIDDF